MSKENLHIGVIMDGNRRYAKKLSLEPWKGHEFGRDALEKILEWCKDREISELTLYTLSIQNLSRPKEEVSFLMNLFRKEFKNFKKNESKIEKNKLKVRFFGRLDLLPEDIQKMARDIEEKTKNYDGYKLNFLFGYGGREEIVDAVKKIISKGVTADEVTQSLIDENVYNASQPELVLRTGGAIRTSNFLIWQSAYSEWIFIDKYFPELTAKDMDAVLVEFRSRNRRFGK